MDYILIGAEMHTLPYATEIKADSLEAKELEQWNAKVKS